jgi:hypothetical protein
MFSSRNSLLSQASKIRRGLSGRERNDAANGASLTIHNHASVYEVENNMNRRAVAVARRSLSEINSLRSLSAGRSKRREACR